MTTHSSILAGEIPWTKGPGRQSLSKATMAIDMQIYTQKHLYSLILLMYEEWSILLNGKICKPLSRCIWLGAQLQSLSSREGEF